MSKPVLNLVILETYIGKTVMVNNRFVGTYTGIKGMGKDKYKNHYMAAIDDKSVPIKRTSDIICLD